MPDAPTGLHHVTAIATDPQQNADFYHAVLGLWLVKTTVNFDAPDTYHPVLRQRGRATRHADHVLPVARRAARAARGGAGYYGVVLGAGGLAGLVAPASTGSLSLRERHSDQAGRRGTVRMRPRWAGPRACRPSPVRSGAGLGRRPGPARTRHPGAAARLRTGHSRAEPSSLGRTVISRANHDHQARPSVPTTVTAQP